MSYPEAILIVLLVGMAAALAASRLDRALSRESRRRHHEVGSPVFQLIGVMYSVLLAFVFSEVWAEYNTAAQAIDTECGALHSASMLADTLPHADAARINAGILDYAHFVLNREWPAMRDRRLAVAQISALREPMNAAASVRSGEVKAQILELIAQAQAARETRLFQAGLGMPVAMWIVVASIGGILIVFVLLAGTEPPATMVLAGSFATSVAMVLVLVRMLDYPFEGALGLGNDRFQTIANQTAVLLHTEQH